MGVTIHNNSKDSKKLNMGYISFMWLRIDIAKIFDKEFGEHYATSFFATVSTKVTRCSLEEDFNMFSKKANEIIIKNKLDEDIVDFLYEPDTNGKIHYKICKKIYDLIKDVKSNKCYRTENDFEIFKEILLSCYKTRSYMRWS